MFREETIAAVATAWGEGGIGIVRISGSEAKNILEKIFTPAKGGPIQNRKLTYGMVADPISGEIIDEALAVFLPSPKTYTREDIAEVNCHGGVVAIRKTLDIVLRQGAAPAEPGEFTKRAFLNGRIDLAQAEAVVDLVKAKAEKSFDSALLQLEGQLSLKIKEIKSRLLALLAHIAANIEYPDEDIEELTYEKLLVEISSISDMIDKMLSTAGTAQIVKEGLKVAITGSPNVGKSSLLNALLGKSRAIVTEIPGTTRDVIEETISINGVPIILFDTAGIRATDDEIEKIGIEKSWESFYQADVVVIMVDGSKKLLTGDEILLEAGGGRNAIVLINKMDLGKVVQENQVRSVLPLCKIICTSVKNNIGLDELEKKIVEIVYGGKVSQSENLLVTNARHKNLLTKALCALRDARQMAEKSAALDFIEVDIRECYGHLGEIIGENATEDIIDGIFAHFCLGK